MGRRFAPCGRAGTFALCALTAALPSCSVAGLGTGAAIPASDKVQVVDNFGASDLEKRFEEVARRVSPTVVAISATEATIETDASLRTDDINPDKLAGMLDAVDRTVGTGFIVDSDGLILTNDHVVAKAEQLWVTTDSHKVYPAIVVASDPRADLAILKIPAGHLPVAHFAPAPVHRGQWTIAIGNPYGLAASGEMAVSIGVVSATNRSLPRLSDKEDRLYSDLIQTTAQINPGNSGGPLFGLNGDVIGVNTAVILPQKQTNGIGFAIPIDAHVMRIIENLKQGRETVYGYLGVKVSSPTPRERREAGMSESGGARIESVEPKSPAALGHLEVGDIVAQLDGDMVHDSDDFVRLIGMSPVSEPVQAVVYHHGSRSVTLNLRVRQSPPQASNPKRFHWRGMLLGPIPSCWDFGADKRPAFGVMVLGIESKSPSISEGIRAGSVITAIADKPVHDVAELQKIVKDTPAEQCRVVLANPTNAVVSAN